jgi:hypothetical protein
VTVRRVALLFFLVALSAVAAFGQISPPILPNGAGCTAPNNSTSCVVANTSYSVPMTDTFPAGPSRTWTLTGNPTVPAGLTIGTATGILSGPVTQSGTFQFVISVTYAGNPGTALTGNYTMAVTGGTGSSLSMATPSPVSGVVNQAVSMQFTASGGTAPYSYAVQSGAVPGLTLNASTGLLSGTATQVGVFSPTVVVTDAATSQTSATGSVTINATATTLSMANPSPVTGAANTNVSMQFTATGGVTPYTYTLQSGSTPPGMLLNSSTGLISGVANTVGTFTPTIQVTDAASSHASATGTITITATATPLTMPNPSSVTVIVGQPVTMTFSASGGATPYTYALIGGTVPGLSLNTATGALSGNTTQVGTFTPTVQVTDSASHQTTAVGSVTVNPVPTTLTMTNPTTVTGTVGQTATIQFTASGGTSPYTYTLQSGNLPAGLNLNAQTGAVTGTATAAGTFTFTIQVADSGSQTATATGTITINPAIPTLTLPTPTAVSGNVGQTMTPRWMQFTATGGTPSYTYSVVAGSLPTGLTLDPQSGAITGTATQPGTFTFIVRVTDSSSPATTAQATATITITFLNVSATITLTTSSGVAITPGGTVTASTQPTVTITLATAPPEALTGNLSVAFQRHLDGQNSREVQFSNGVFAPQFTVAAGSTTATFAGGGPLSLLVGTAAGVGQISVSFKDALGNIVTSPTVQPFVFSVTGTAPVIKTFTLSCTGSVYTATIIGFSSTLDVSNVVFNFTPTSGTVLAASTLTVPVGPVFSVWFGSSQSNQFGGQFMLTVPMAFTHPAGATNNPIASATVTMTNSQATSAASPSASPSPPCS